MLATHESADAVVPDQLTLAHPVAPSTAPAAIGLSHS
jgi:hypothetical protein